MPTTLWLWPRQSSPSSADVARSRSLTLLAGGLTLAILAGCSSTPTGIRRASSPGPPGAGTFSEADVQHAVDDLARVGVETRIRPSDSAPITAITGDPSPVRLLRTQVRNLALEAGGGGGTKGTDLDALTSAGGGGPVSALIAGWAATGTTPGATLGATLLGKGGASDAAGKVFPSLALVAFVADVDGGTGGASSRPSNLLVTSAGYCAEISAYLSDALNGIVNSTADPPAWLKQLIDLYAPQYKDNPGLLQKTIGALALLSYATSLARPWTVSLLPDPAAVAYGIEGEDPVEGEVDLTVISGADVFADDVADCASLADAQLASVPVEGSSVVWDSSGLGAHATDVAGQSQVDDTGTAALTYQTATESKEDADNGDPVTRPRWGHRVGRSGRDDGPRRRRQIDPPGRRRRVTRRRYGQGALPGHGADAQHRHAAEWLCGHRRDLPPARGVTQPQPGGVGRHRHLGRDLGHRRVREHR